MYVLDKTLFMYFLRAHSYILIYIQVTILCSSLPPLKVPPKQIRGVLPGETS